MRNILWILVAVVIAAGAYWLYTGQSPRDIAIEVDEPEPAPETDAVVDEPAEDAVTDTAPAADETADPAPAEDPAPEPAEDTATADEPATDTTEEDAATEPATDTTDTDATTDTTVTDATTDTTETDATTDTAAADDAQEVLTVDGFDFERVNELIENSDLEPAQKTLLASSLEQAQDSPELLGEVLDRIREALDL